MLETIFFFVCGLLIGYSFCDFWKSYTRVVGGVLHIDSESFPDEPPYYFLEIDHRIGDISDLDTVAFKVVKEHYVSRN